MAYWYWEFPNGTEVPYEPQNTPNIKLKVGIELSECMYLATWENVNLFHDASHGCSGSTSFVCEFETSKRASGKNVFY